MRRRRLRIAVVGHVEHVTLGRVAALPRPGEIVHLEAPCVFAGGGGGMALHQLAKSDAELHAFTAFGAGETGAWVRAALEGTGVRVHGLRRSEDHGRVLVLVTPDGERTILVAGGPHHARAADRLPWSVLARCDAVYFIGDDPEVLRRARRAPLLVVAARRRPVLDASGVRADVVVGSRADPREDAKRGAYRIPPGALVLTEGALGGELHTGEGASRFPASPTPHAGGAAYGAGDSFAAALVWYLALGRGLEAACREAAVHGAAVLRGPDPPRAQRPLAAVAPAGRTP